MKSHLIVIITGLAVVGCAPTGREAADTSATSSFSLEAEPTGMTMAEAAQAIEACAPGVRVLSMTPTLAFRPQWSATVAVGGRQGWATAREGTPDCTGTRGVPLEAGGAAPSVPTTLPPGSRAAELVAACGARANSMTYSDGGYRVQVIGNVHFVTGEAHSCAGAGAGAAPGADAGTGADAGAAPGADAGTSTLASDSAVSFDTGTSDATDDPWADGGWVDPYYDDAGWGTSDAGGDDGGWEGW